MPKGQMQMAFLAVLASAITVATFAYLFATSPTYLRETRDGVPYFTPPVINPVTGKSLNANGLVRRYKGDVGAGAAAGVD